MSLDVYLTLEGENVDQGTGIFIRENGRLREISLKEWEEKFPNTIPIIVQQEIEDDENDCVFSYNITHNLNIMAEEAGLYTAMWHPEDANWTHAKDIIAPLKEGLDNLKSNPDHYKTFNLKNGWGDYEGLVHFAESYLEACLAYPDALIETST